MNRVLPSLFKFCLTLCVGLGLTLVYLNAHLTKQFQSLSWSVGAKIYARPLELYQGAPFTKDQILYELDILNYSNVPSRPKTGFYSDGGKNLVIGARGHDFPDGVEIPRRVAVEFDQQGIKTIRDAKNAPIDLLRLEPVVLAQLSGANADREVIELDELPEKFTSLLLAVEDRQFYDHQGISPLGILRALVNNIVVGRFAQGGSTLTQQLVKNLYLTRERTLNRKVLEAIYAILLDASFSKDRILRAYINEVFLGQWGNRAIHGFGTASQFYFGRPISELSIAEQALLIGLVKGPSAFNPRRHPERAIKRRNLVLSLAEEQGAVSVSERKRATAESLKIPSKPADRLGRFPGYVDLVARELAQDYSSQQLTVVGLKIYTAFDPQAHRGLVEGRRDTLSSLVTQELDPKKEVQLGALIVDIPTGEIQALLASRDDRHGFHRVLDARRQIGSLVKPFVVAAALEENLNFHGGTLVRDQAITLQDAKDRVWSPQNYDHSESGIVRLETVISKSINQATVHLAVGLGLDKILDRLIGYGIRVDLSRPPSTILGVSEMSPFSIAERYQGLLNQGYLVPLKAVRSVVGQDNKELSRKRFKTKSMLAARYAVMVDHMMRIGAKFGTGRTFGNAFDQIMASKTGTTDDGRDAWFIGADGRRLGVAWVGFDDNRNGNLIGAVAALPIIRGGFRYIDRADRSAILPSGLRYGWVDQSGQIVNKSCDGANRRPLPKELKQADDGDCRNDKNNSIERNWFKEWFGQ